MSETVVILVNGEVLAGTVKSTIEEQKKNAYLLADSLLPILKSDLNIVLMHGNKPQVGYVLFRSELASHVLHQLPMDVCGADTQGATGYMLSQSLINTLRKNDCDRSVMSIVTQTIVDKDSQDYNSSNRQIGPWLDRNRAEQRRQLFGWNIVQKSGYGFRRVVPSPPPLEIVELDGIKQLANSGMIVVAAGGGGIPVVSNDQGMLEGLEVVVDTDHVASILARELRAKRLLMVVEDDVKFLEAGLYISEYQHLSLEEFKRIDKEMDIPSNFLQRKIHSVENFLADGGRQVIITTLQLLKTTLQKGSGLWLGEENLEFDLAEYISAKMES
jgi:carbamate kinase